MHTIADLLTPKSARGLIRKKIKEGVGREIGNTVNGSIAILKGKHIYQAMYG